MAVEFAMVSALFITLFLGTIETGRIFWTWNALQYAVEETARYAAVHQSATNSALVTYATAKMATVHANTTALIVTVTNPNPVISGITFVEVTGTYNFASVAPTLLPWFSINLTAKSKVPLVL